MFSALIIAQILAAPAAKLTYANQVFTLAGPDWTERVPIVTKPAAPAKTFEFQDGTFAIDWDGKKMTVRQGKYSRSTQFVDVPTSPRLFSKEQIRDAIEGVEKGTRTMGASAVSGYEIAGNFMYLLMRWHDSDEKPIFEALIRLDMTEKVPWFKVVDKMPGVSMATGPVADELFTENGRLSFVSRTDDAWGISSWDLAQEFKRFVPVGTGLFRYSLPSAAPTSILFSEKSAYGTYLAGRVDLATRQRENLGEGPEKVSFVSSSPVVLRFDSPDGCRIRYAETGLEKTFPAWTAARMTAHGLLTWLPSTNPAQATAYDLQSFSPIAKWFKPKPITRPATVP